MLILVLALWFYWGITFISPSDYMYRLVFLLISLLSLPLQLSKKGTGGGGGEDRLRQKKKLHYKKYERRQMTVLEDIDVY